MAGRSIQAQVVLYRNDLDEVQRLTIGLMRSFELAMSQGAMSQASLVFGDCSPEPAIDAEALEELGRRCERSGTAAPTYRFFDANLQHSQGMNALAAGATADLLLILNPDCYVAPRCVTELLMSWCMNSIGFSSVRMCFS